MKNLIFHFGFIIYKYNIYINANHLRYKYVLHLNTLFNINVNELVSYDLILKTIFGIIHMEHFLLI